MGPIIKPHFGRKALVGQFVKEETDGMGMVIRRVDQSARINFDRSKKYPFSSKRQQDRERRRHFYVTHGYRLP